MQVFWCSPVCLLLCVCLSVYCAQLAVSVSICQSLSVPLSLSHNVPSSSGCVDSGPEGGLRRFQRPRFDGEQNVFGKSKIRNRGRQSSGRRNEGCMLLNG